MDTPINDENIKRSILRSVRIRFSPETKYIREAILDNLIKRNLLFNHHALSIEELQTVPSAMLDDIPVFPLEIIKQTLERLIKKGVVIKTTEVEETSDKKIISKIDRYKLSESANNENKIMLERATIRLNKTVEALLPTIKDASSLYAVPFLECLCHIFANLGERYVQIDIVMEKPDILLKSTSLSSIATQIAKKYKGTDKTLLQKALFSFFKDTRTPRFGELKWNLAQNYYVLIALSLDQGSSLLSSELFSGDTLYLDTNVLIEALEPGTPYHISFASFTKACERLQIKLKVISATIDELSRFSDNQRQLLQNIIIKDGKIKSVPKGIREPILNRYIHKLKDKAAVNIDELLSNYHQAKKKLKKSFSIDVVSINKWCQKSWVKENTVDLVNLVQVTYKKRFFGEKPRQLAIHDALLLGWVEYQRKETKSNDIWLLTMDNTIPLSISSAPDKDTPPLTITLDATLQWISPIAMKRGNEQYQAAKIFAEAVKHQVLPVTEIFALPDVRTMQKIDSEVLILPPETVERVVDEVVNIAPSINPNNPKSREEINAILLRAVTNPETAFYGLIESYKDEVDELREENYGYKLRAFQKKLCVRITFIVLFILAIQAGVTYFANLHGEGLNLFQNILKAWPIHLTAFTASLYLSQIILGKDILDRWKIPRAGRLPWLR